MEEEKMPLTSHLEELRKRLVRILIAVGVGFVVCYYVRDYLYYVITRPLVSVLPKGSHMIFTGLPEAFFVYMKICFFASLFLTSPFTFYQLWKFVSPGLYPHERRYVAPFVISSTFLFLLGIAFGYFIVLPPAFGFFVSFSTDFLKPMISFKEYLSFSLKLLFAFGLSFELPVLIYFLTKIGVVSSRLLKKQRRYAILIIFIIAAILTPSPDAFTQILMALPLLVLYELGIILAKWAEKKKVVKHEEAQ
ncbi:MAG TPA: twin-arginine translocase subunit TatC [Syntrophales bacterium]|nr:twin-arginine translocase subunit TatC [Syntrophales bacterium]HOL58849.1 twin-arginine translocase subunit TatC [Syntrophales bacterium]HPO35176.1 twin-arginine translocase subunit TatC [Syntrophales bacterium]